MISNEPVTKEEFERFMVGVRARSEERRQQQRNERIVIAVAGVIFAVGVFAVMFGGI